MPSLPEAMPIDAPEAYPFPKGREKLMPWTTAAEQLEQAKVYWLATVRHDGRPHIAPIWGAWVDDAFYFQGAPNSRWARNLGENPAASIHLESVNDVVIVDGLVEQIVTDAAFAARLVEAWRAKYVVVEHPPQADTAGIFRLRPRAVRAWGETFQDAARWLFADS
jgi:nitroimidazol reductase NimA-like FMN-containing flavoprotein (pyridoxamine 5'-phosphate oxidase superfamily)